MAGVYVPRSPTTGVLYGVIRTHLADFLAAVEARTDGSGLPPSITAEFRKFLRRGVLAHGFARVRCGDCAFERLVPFSCKGRFCPSCGGAAHEARFIRRGPDPGRQIAFSNSLFSRRLTERPKSDVHWICAF